LSTVTKILSSKK